MIELTYDKAVELLDAAVAEKGTDYVYLAPDVDHGACLYVHPDDSDPKKPGSCGCIVGYVLHKAGVPLEAMFGVHADSGSLLNDLQGKEIVAKVDGRTRALLRKAQVHQDQEAAWSTAVRWAKRYTEDNDDTYVGGKNGGAE